MKNNCVFWITVLLILSQCSTVETTEEEGYLAINGSEIYFKTMGQGPPMIVVHGGPVLDHSYFLPHFETLAKDHQLIFYDQRACGQSSADVDTASMSLAGFIDEIKQLKQHLNLDKVNLLGHSWGGLLAMKYAIQYPDDIDHLILSNSMPASTGTWQEEEGQIASKITREDSIIRANFLSSPEIKSGKAPAIKKLMMLSFKPQFHNKNLLDSLHIYIPEDFMYRSEKFSYLGNDLASFDLYEELGHLKVSTLIIYGDAEPAATISGDKLSDIIHNSELLVIKNCGHFPFVEQSNEYFAAINRFILK